MSEQIMQRDSIQVTQRPLPVVNAFNNRDSFENIPSAQIDE
jgi:hypothetical protein